MNRQRNNHRSTADESWLLDVLYALLRIARWMMGNHRHLKPVPVAVRKGPRPEVTGSQGFPDSFVDLGVPHCTDAPSHPAARVSHQDRHSH
ncbi:MAG: hypothetical protein QGH11_05375, partial [Pirellulaceae bacterium]|nr:hypothetical protein [Pirellulaceae bacterium]